MTFPKTKKEIANHLEIDCSTLRRWLKKSNLYIPRGYISPPLVTKVYEKLGYEKKLKDFESQNRRRNSIY